MRPEYQYHLKDHLGNVRLTFTTKEEVEEATATLEAAHASEEQGEFLNYAEARKIDNPMFDHTDEGGTFNAVRLMGGNTTETYGLAKSLSVMPGDVINMEVYAKYLDPNPANWSTALLNIIQAIAGTTNPGGTFVDGGAIGSINGPFPYPGLLTRDNDTGDGPKAYLNYIIFDREFNYINGGFRRVSTAAREAGQGTDPTEGIGHEHLFLENITITEPGYVYIYLSNENETPVEVFFDDFRVEHIKSPVVQMDDYYPFGLTFNSYQRENSTKNQYQYNGKEMQDELDLGWLDYGARMYLSDIGRWGAIDPMANKYYNQGVYNYVANIPTKLIDPNGMEIGYDKDMDPDTKKQIRRTVNQLRFRSKAFRQGWRQLNRSSSVYTLKSGKVTDMVLRVKGGDGTVGMFDGVYGMEGDSEMGTVNVDPVVKTGGDILISTGVVNDNENRILERTIAEETTHALQYDNVVKGEPSNAYKSNMPGLLDMEFEAKAMTGFIMEQGNYKDSKPDFIDVVPYYYGKQLANKGKSLAEYQKQRGEFFRFVDLLPNGYSGVKTTDPGAVKNSNPEILKKLIKN